VECGVEEANDAIALRLDVETPHLPGARALEDIRHDAADGAWLISGTGRDLRRHGRDRIALDLNRLSAVGEVAVHRQVRIRDWHRSAWGRRFADVWDGARVGHAVPFVQDAATVRLNILAHGYLLEWVP
jgi:hypothetical protein